MQNIVADDLFFQQLREIDYDLFLKVKSGRCLLCGGPLDTGNFPRKPRGLGTKEELRFGLCCRRTGCRSRVTTPSLRFFGRMVYSAWVVILAVDFCKELGLHGRIARQTIARWGNLWRDRLSEQSPFMRQSRSFLPLGVLGCESPGVLLPIFKFPEKIAWIPILKFFIL